ncbi:hypothetical protein ACP4OV_012597 [Aristida adscensionis]
MATLSGAHTIGQAQCQSFKDHIYNDNNVDVEFATSLRANCPKQPNGTDDGKLAPLDGDARRVRQ